MSHFSSWNCHTLTTRRSPSRIHIRFFSFPGIRPSRLFPSWHITRIRDAPRSWSAIPRISPSFPRGMRTRTTSSSGTTATMRRETLNVFGGYSRRPTAPGWSGASSSGVSPTGTYGNGTAGVEPGVELCLAPPSARVLTGTALGRVDDVRAIHVLELPPETTILDAGEIVDHLPELLPRSFPLLEDHQGGQDRRELELARNLKEARSVLPHERQPTGLRLHAVELLRRLAYDALCVDH